MGVYVLPFHRHFPCKGFWINLIDLKMLYLFFNFLVEFLLTTLYLFFIFLFEDVVIEEIGLSNRRCIVIKGDYSTLIKFARV